MKRQIANIITGCRIFGSTLLLFFPAFSLSFYITYTLCGFSDMIDGTIARKTNSTYKFGSQLDTIADLTYDYEQSNRTTSVPITFDNILRRIEIYCHSSMLYRNIFCNSRRVLCYSGL